MNLWQWIISLFTHVNTTTTTTTKPNPTTTTTTTKTNPVTTTTTTTKPSGGKMKASLSIGINKYPNPANNLSGCVNDAQDFYNLLKNVYGFNQCKTLFDSDATLQNVTDNILALLAQKPDVLVITNSSHGTRVVDTTGEEADGYDEAICLYDKFLVDKDFHKILTNADPKTHVIVISDSCHSAGVTREFLAAMNDFSYASKPRYLPPEDPMEAIRVSMLPIKKAIFEPDEEMNEVLIAGCKSSEFSYDAEFNYRPNGAASYYILQILNSTPNITYADFISKLNQFLPSSQYPQCPVLECNSDTKNKIIFS